MNPSTALTEIDRLLSEHRAELVRNGHHMVYKLPNGATFIQPKIHGSSDEFAAVKQLADLKRAIDGRPNGIARPNGFASLNPPAPPEAPPEAPRALATATAAAGAGGAVFPGSGSGGFAAVCPPPVERSAAVEAPPVPAPPVTAPASPASKKDPPPAAPEPVRTEGEEKKSRIESALTRLTERYNDLLAQAQKVEKAMNILKAVAPFLDEDSEEVETALRAIFPKGLPGSAPPTPPRPSAAPEVRTFHGPGLESANHVHHAAPPAPPVPAAPGPAKPPIVEAKSVTDRVMVTNQLVYAATQTFADRFTVNDVMARMVGDREVDAVESKRIRSAVTSCLFALLEKGMVDKKTTGNRTTQSLWTKVPIRAGDHARA